MHLRTQIKQAVRQLLLNNTAAEDRIYLSRIDPVGLKKLPAIQIYAKEESVDGDMPGGRNRLLTLIIGAVAAGPDCDEQADDLASDIEVLMDDSGNISDLVSDVKFVSTLIEYSGDGERNLAEANLNFEILYVG